MALSSEYQIQRIQFIKWVGSSSSIAANAELIMSPGQLTQQHGAGDGDGDANEDSEGNKALPAD